MRIDFEHDPLANRTAILDAEGRLYLGVTALEFLTLDIGEAHSVVIRKPAGPGEVQRLETMPGDPLGHAIVQVTPFTLVNFERRGEWRILTVAWLKEAPRCWVPRAEAPAHMRRALEAA